MAERKSRSGTQIPHAQRKGRRVEVYLDSVSEAALTALIEKHGTDNATEIRLALIERAARELVGKR